MSAAYPTFSVIVACKNPGRRLDAALVSVWSQRDAIIDLIVVDGASTDGTAEMLAANRTRIATLICEPDRGVYDAMNKGIAVARGDWVLFLGADDRLAHDSVLADTARNLVNTEAAVAVGEVMYDDGRVYRLRARPNAIARNFVHHQGAFYQRAVFAEFGSYDLSQRIMADYDLNTRLWKAGARFRSLPVRIAVCGSAGLSDQGSWLGYREEITVRHRHFAAWQCWTWDAGSVIRYLRKRCLRRSAPRHG